MKLEAKYTPRDASRVWNGSRFYDRPTPPTIYFRYTNGKSAGRIHGKLATAIAKRHELKAWCLWTEIDAPVVLLEVDSDLPPDYPPLSEDIKGWPDVASGDNDEG